MWSSLLRCPGFKDRNNIFDETWEVYKYSFLFQHYPSFSNKSGKSITSSNVSVNNYE